jgi:opacity protein-like surface antigen
MFSNIVRNCILVVGLSAQAFSLESGPYIGAGYGISFFSDGGEIDEFEKLLKAQYGNRASASYDDTDSGYKIYTGYLLNDMLGAELSYTNYGTYDAIIKDSITNTKATVVDTTPTTIALSANVGYTFETFDLRLFGLFGLGYMTIKDWYNNDNAVAMHFGTGAEYYLLEHIGLRVAFEGDFFSIKSEINKDDSNSASLTMFYFGAHYKF